MDSKLELKYNINLASCTSDDITALLKSLIPLVVEEVFSHILIEFAHHYKLNNCLPHECSCGAHSSLKWAHIIGRKSTLKTQWTDIKIPQLQVQCTRCGEKKSMARPLLGMKPRCQTPQNLKDNVALFTSLMPFRVCSHVLKFTGTNMSKTQAWRCAQKVGQSIEFGLDENGCKAGMADGTGVGIQGIKKRGQELKVFAQRKKNGGLHIAGVTIGKYDNENNWRELFEPLQQSFEKMGEFNLTLDGDCSIIKAFDANINLSIQRCLWHIPHQFKHYLWQDKIKRKSSLWCKIMSRCLELIALPRQIVDDPKIIDVMLKSKEEQYNNLILLLQENDCSACLAHLTNAYPNMFTNFRKRLKGKTTSLIERIMRTVNLRTNVGKWSSKGALNIIKIRLAFYYNGFRPTLKYKQGMINGVYY